MKHIIHILLMSFGILFFSCSKKEGCTDIMATNYDLAAEKDDGSCVYENLTQETGTFKLSFSATVSNGNSLVLNQIYTDSANYAIKIEGFKFYISNLTLVKVNNQEVKIKAVDLIKLGTSDADNSTSADVLVGDYKAVKFGIGLDSVQNASDPATFNNDHPLSLFENTYWNWSSQYRFIMLEARTDTIKGNSSNLDQLLIFHTGLNTLYREYEENINFSISLNNTYEKKLNINLNKIFYGTSGTIDLVEESVTHATTNYPLALKFTDNFMSAIE